MSPRPIDELIVSAARDEPMALEERARLDAALAGSSELRESLQAQQALSAALGALGASLQRAASLRDAEPVLRAAFQVRQSAVARPRRWPAALAASLAAAALLPLVWLGLEQHAGTGPGPAEPFADESVSSAGFQPLLYAPRLSPSRAYSVVRVEIPVSALTAQYASDLDGTIEADILIGEDGLPTGIRFAPGDGAFVQTISQ